MTRARISLATSLAALALLVAAPTRADAKTARATLTVSALVVSSCELDVSDESRVDSQCARYASPRIVTAVEQGHNVTTVHF